MRSWVERVDDVISREATYRAEQLTANTDSLSAREVQDTLDNIGNLRPLREQVGERLALAESLERRSIDEAREPWDQAIAARACLPAAPMARAASARTDGSLSTSSVRS